MSEHRLQQPELRKLRAMQMLQLRIEGISVKAIAAKFNCSKDTVDRDLGWAIRNGFVSTIETDILTDLVPEALKVYRDKLKNEKSEYVAKHVIDVVLKLGDRFSNASNNDKNLGLKAYLETKRIAKEEKKHGESKPTGKTGEPAKADPKSSEPELPRLDDAPGETEPLPDDGTDSEPLPVEAPGPAGPTGPVPDSDDDGE